MPSIKSKELISLLKKSGVLVDESYSLTNEKWNQVLKKLDEKFCNYEEEINFLEKSLSSSIDEMETEIQKNKVISMQLAQAGKLASLGTLASGIAHELNNPLAGIKGNCELMVLKTDLCTSQKNYVEKIMKLCDRMAGITNNMLRLARRTNNSQAESVDLEASIHECLDLLQSKFLHNDIAISINSEAPRPYVMGNFHSLLSIFQNILSNCWDAFIDRKESLTDKKIDILIEEMSDKNYVRITIEDNAGGMSAETVSKIFDPFYTTKGVGEGTGLGMGITKQIITDMGGRICVDSSEGVGSKFMIYLPLSEDEPLNEKEDRVAELESTLSNFKIPIELQKEGMPKILVIDDEDEICNYFQELLQGHYSITTTLSSDEALSKLKTEKYDIVISDIQMPRVTGFQIGSYVKTHQPDVNLVFISGDIDKKETDEMLLKFHPCVFIPKPFPAPVVMLKLIKDLIQD